MAKEAPAEVTDPKPETKPESGKDTTILEQPAPLVDATGKFRDGWRDSLAEEIRAEKLLDNVTDLPNAINQLVNLKKMVGRDKVVVPNEKSKPEEWDVFYTAAGRPQTADDYQVAVPADLQEIFPANRLKEARQLAHTLGVSQKQFAAYMQYEMDQAVKLLQEDDQQRVQERDAADQALHKEFGVAYPDRMEAARQLVHQVFAQEEPRMAFLEKYGSDPDFIRFASVVGGRLSEDKARIAELTTNTPAEAQKKIKELQGTPGYMEYASTKMTNEERQTITDKIRELTKQAYPEPARAGGR